MASFLQKLRGSPDEDEIKKRADASAAKYAAETGQPLKEEEGLEEGDISDYVMPFKGLGKNILKAVAEKSVQAGAKAIGKAAVKEGVKDVEKGAINYAKNNVFNRKPETQGADYAKENIAFRPTTKPKQEGWDRFSFGKKSAQ